MIKSILSWSTALLVLCSGLLASCDDKDEGGGNPPAPAVTLAVGDAASNTLKFTLTLSDADKCTYVCTKSSEAVPSAEKILAALSFGRCKTTTTSQSLRCLQINLM